VVVAVAVLLALGVAVAVTVARAVEVVVVVARAVTDAVAVGCLKALIDRQKVVLDD
jgi:hypothetical protein